MENTPPNKDTTRKSNTIKRKALRLPYSKSRPTQRPFPKYTVHVRPPLTLPERRLDEANTSPSPPCTPCSVRRSYLNNLLRRTLPNSLHSELHTRDYLMGRFAACGSVTGRPSYLYQNRREHCPNPLLTHWGTRRNVFYQEGFSSLSDTSDFINMALESSYALRREYRNYYSSHSGSCRQCSPLDAAISRIQANRLVCRNLPIGTSEVGNSSDVEMRHSSVEVTDVSPLNGISPSEINNVNMGRYKSDLVNATTNVCGTDESEVYIESSACEEAAEKQEENVSSRETLSSTNKTGSTEKYIKSLMKNMLTDKDTSESSSESSPNSETTYVDALETSEMYVRDLFSTEISRAVQGNESPPGTDNEFEELTETVRKALTEEINTALKSNSSNIENEMTERKINNQKLGSQELVHEDTNNLMASFTFLLEEKIDTTIKDI